jgi:transposase
MQKLVIIEPKKIERQINAFINKDPEGKFIFRLCSLKMLLHDSTYTTDSLGQLMGVSPRSVAQWIHNINSAGSIEVLRDKQKSGRNPRLTGKQMELLKVQLQKHPNELGLDANLWDGKTLSHHIKKQFGIAVQVRQCQRIFSKLGLVDIPRKVCHRSTVKYAISTAAKYASVFFKC